MFRVENGVGVCLLMQMEVHVVVELFSLVSPQWLSLFRFPPHYYYFH